MKREFSFYEFVGILVPGVILLFFLETFFEIVYAKTVIDFSKIGESIVFLIIAYGCGHLLQAIGNLYEWVIWKVIRGMPSHWLTKKARFNQTLFDAQLESEIKNKIFKQFGEESGRDYSKSVYVFLSMKSLTSRIDIFNANYSLFRGLAVVFFILGVMYAQHLSLSYVVILFSLFLLATYRMIKFAKLYAREMYLTFNNLT